MTSFYVAKLLENQGIYRPDTIIIGEVELRPPSSDLDEEQLAITISIEKNNADVNQKVNCRVGTVVTADTIKDAELLADERFVKALDIISAELPISNISLTNCGYIKNLSTGEYTSLEYKKVVPSTAFMLRKGAHQIYEFSQWLAVQDSELAIRYRRSLHWSRNAKWEKNLQIRILFSWFAVEALFKESETDNVEPLIRWFLGYPNGDLARHVDSSTIAKLRSNPLYDKWKQKILKSLDEMRIFRNNSVHSGFRNVDYSVTEVKFYNQLISYGCSRCQGAVVTALGDGVKTVKEFKENIYYFFETNRNLINDIHGTILYSLEHNTFDNLYQTVYR